MDSDNLLSMEAFTFPQKPLKEYSRGEVALTILKCVTLGILVAGAVVVPGMAHALTLFKPKNAKERYRVRRAIRSLEQGGFIERVTKADGRVRPTVKGRSAAQYDALAIPKVRWDGTWRLFMFDIPEEKRSARLTLGRKVLAMGMRHFQKSVFISPYPCEKELRCAVAYHGVEKNVRFAVASEISEEVWFKKQFGI